MTDPVEARANLREHLQPHLAVGVVEIDVLPAVTPGSDMIKTTGEFESERACHRRRVSESGVPMQD